jgi:hypothetical protein
LAIGDSLLLLGSNHFTPRLFRTERPRAASPSCPPRLPRRIPRLLIHPLIIPQQTIVPKLIPALPQLAWQPEHAREQERVARIEERLADDALPCVGHGRVARLQSRGAWVEREIQVDEVVALLYRDLNKRQQR